RGPATGLRSPAAAAQVSSTGTVVREGPGMEEQSVHELVLRWREWRREGRSVTIGELCAGCPELTEAGAREIAGPAFPEAFLATDLQGTTGASAAPTTAPGALLPEQAGRFRLLGEIARGGMGAVLRAHDPAIGRDVAIKVVLPQHRQDPAVVRRFLEE